MPFPSAEAITSMPKKLAIKMESSRGLGNFAVYTLVKLKNPTAFLEAVRSEDDFPEELKDNAQFPPQYDFAGRTMKDIVGYQQQLYESGGKEKWDYSLFIVAVHEDYIEHGVLIGVLINEYYQDTEAVPALLRCPLQSDLPRYSDAVFALSWCVNLQIANMDVEDLRDQDDSIMWPSPVPGYAELQAALVASGQELKRKAQVEFEALPTREQRYAVHHIGDLDRDTGTMQYDVEPDVFYKEEVQMEHKIATTNGVVVAKGTTDEERWQLVRRRHPGRCSEKHTTGEDDDMIWIVNKFWMFAFDQRVADGGHTVALVQARWDGITEGKTKDQLEAIMPELDIVERCPVGEALARMDVISGFGSGSST